MMLACGSMALPGVLLFVLGFSLWVLGLVLLFANIFLIQTARNHRAWHWRWFFFSLVWAVAFCSGLLPGEASNSSGNPHNLFIFYTLITPIFVIGQFVVLLVHRICAKRKLRAFQALLSSDESDSPVPNSGQHDPLAS
jgi:hypothetical protein